MLFEETRSVRAFIGRIDPGDDVVDALTLACNVNDISAATVRVTGTIANVELGRYDAASRSYQPVFTADDTLHIANLTGRVAAVGDRTMLQLDALLAAHGPLGAQLAFGELLRARAVDCEFVVEVPADVELARTPDAATGRFPITALRPSASPAAPVETPRERREPETISKPAGTATSAPVAPPQPVAALPEPEEDDAPSMSWAAAIEASDEVKPASRREPRPITSASERGKVDDPYASLDLDEPLLSAGDILDHPKLGECRVIKVEDEEYAHIRLPRGQIRKLALDLIELRYVGERDGKNFFKARVGR